MGASSAGRETPLWLVFTAFLAATALALMAWPEKAAARQEGPYAGIDQCAACHEETVAAFRSRSMVRRASRCARPTRARPATARARPTSTRAGGRDRW